MKKEKKERRDSMGIFKRILNVFLSLIFVFFFTFLLYSFYDDQDVFIKNEKTDWSFLQENLELKQEVILEKRFERLKVAVNTLAKDRCLRVWIGSGDEGFSCELNKSLEECLFARKNYSVSPVCIKYQKDRLTKPEKIRAVYYTVNSAASDQKIENLIKLKREGKINAVLIDVKEVGGEFYLPFVDESFGKIKPVSNVRIKDPATLIEKLHEYGIYVIARIVVFKDESLVNLRNDLAVKKKSDKQKPWADYSGKVWLDPGAREVWNYIFEMSSVVANYGFDEINLDYIRFPSDGLMSDVYYPFSDKEISSGDVWARSKVLDGFFKDFTSKMKEDFPKLALSADVFGYAAMDYGDTGIGQILENAILRFDYVAPMTYPSHYAYTFVPFDDGPDNHPYEVLTKTLKRANKKINDLNFIIKRAIDSGEDLEIRPGFFIDNGDLAEVSKDKMRLWIQGFTCTWCNPYQRYGYTQIQDQIRAIEEIGSGEWMVWNPAARYLPEWFDAQY